MAYLPEENVLHCQSRCAKTAGCAHFTYWPNRGCHLQSMEARPQFASRVTAGPPDCREGFRMKTCFHENTKFEPVNMPGQRRTQVGSVLECQQRCRQTTGCEHFSLWPDGGCHIQDANASEVTARHIISGPRHCTKSYPMRIDETALAPLEDEETANDDDVDDGQRTLDEPESDVLGVASSDPESDLVPQPRAVALVLAASQYVVEGFLEAEDFEREVRGCNITTVKEAEFEQLRQMIKFLRREELCPSDEPHHPKVPDPLSTDCLVPDGPWEQRVLSRMAVIQRIKLEKEGAPSLQECHCPEPAGELLTSSKLLEVVENQDIARSPLMMRDAARQVCTEKGQDSGVSLAVVFNNACSVGKRGYCCEARDLRWSAVPLRLRGDELAEESLVHLMGLAESLRSDSEKIYWKFLRKLEDWKWLSNEQKVMFYKLYIIYYHHVRLAIERQQYCMLNPEDLTSCEDPMNLYFSIKVVRNEILQSHRALFEYGSCLQLGTRTIAATVRGRPVAAKVRGIAGILFRRAVHILGTGQIQRRVHRAALQLARSAWTHRFELILGLLKSFRRYLAMALCLWALLLSVACGVDVPSVQLNNGVSMPVLAFAAEVWDAGTCLNATAEALAAGFRFAAWPQMKAQSQAVRNSGLPGTELFIAGTVNDPKCSDYASCYKETRAGAEKQFQLLDEKVLDMLMLDYPAESCRGIKGQWQALTDLYRQTGRVRSIAVSNFNLTQIQCATSWEFVTMEPEVPAVSFGLVLANQMRFAVGHGHDPVVAQDAKLGIRVQAYSPLAKGKLATDALCQKIGKSHGKSAVQAAMRRGLRCSVHSRTCVGAGYAARIQNNESCQRGGVEVVPRLGAVVQFEAVQSINSAKRGGLRTWALLQGLAHPVALSILHCQAHVCIFVLLRSLLPTQTRPRRLLGTGASGLRESKHTGAKPSALTSPKAQRLSLDDPPRAPDWNKLMEHCSRFRMHFNIDDEPRVPRILQSNATIATQSTSPQHLRSDLDLFDFSLTDEEMQQLNDHSPELFVVSLVLGAGQPLMQALTATGVSTGAATSWTLILEQFMRNMFVHVGCPILSSPLLMAMLLRWSMNRIILTEFFINNAVQPLWEMAKKALEPVATFMQINKEVFRTSADVLKTIMRAVRLRQDPAQSVETNSTSDDRQSWIEAAREFHATAAADVFYAFLSVTFGAAWRALATAACTVEPCLNPKQKMVSLLC
eukprot:s35_g1.t3